MKHINTIATATTFAAIIFAGTAMADNTFPCSKAQFWITSMSTVPAGADSHRNNHQINIASAVLQPRVRVAEKTSHEIVASR